MWILTSLKDPNDSMVLLVDRKYTVGRQDSDITIPTDKSISRKHATLQVTHPETNISQPHKPPILTVTDSSKFGTIVRDKKLKGEQCIITSGNQIKFGTMDSAYRAEYRPLLVTTSCLDPQSKKETKALIGQLGGHVVSDWRKDCEVLVMTSLSVTVKVICALVSQKPIVTVQYFKEFVKSVQSKTKAPSPDDYLPPLAESQLNPTEVSFQKNESRKTLFEGKVFIFLSTKQFKKLNVAVELAGGTPMLMEEGTDDNEDDILVAPHTCVMHTELGDPAQNLSQNATEWIQHVKKVLAKHKRRSIPDSELGYAVLYCSTERYCNPTAEPVTTQLTVQQSEQSISSQAQLPKTPRPPPQSNSAQHSSRQQPSKILAPETPSQEAKRRVSCDGGPTVVPETLQTSILHDVGATVKTEPMSQSADDIFRDIALSDASRSPRKPPTRKKRPREEETEDVSSPAAKSLRTNQPAGNSTNSEQVTVKKEPVSPVVSKSGPERNNNTYIPAGVEVKQSPKTVLPSKTRRTEPTESDEDGNNDLDEIDALFGEFDAGAKRKTRRGSRSPSPAPKQEASPSRSPARNTRSRRSPSPAGNTRSRRSPSPAGNTRSRRSPSPAGNTRSDRSPSPARSSRSKRSPSPKAKDTEPTVARRGGRSPSPKPNSVKQSLSPKPKPVPTKRSQRSPSPRPEVNSDLGDSSKWKKRKPAELDQPAAKRPHKSSAKVKEEPQNMEEEEEAYVEETSAPRGPTPAGFLNKDRAHRVAVSEEAEHDDQPSNLMKVETVSLISRRPRPNRSDAAATAATVNGKNFKKFSKVSHAGANKLPVIIGASDLEVNNTNMKRLDEWFNEHEAELSQRNEMDQLFEFQPRASTAPRKRTGRR